MHLHFATTIENDKSRKKPSLTLSTQDFLTMLLVRLACLTSELETHAEYLALSDGGTASALPLCNTKKKKLKKITKHLFLFFFPLQKKL